MKDKPVCEHCKHCEKQHHLEYLCVPLNKIIYYVSAMNDKRLATKPMTVGKLIPQGYCDPGCPLKETK